jgi:hypothetical protein
MSFNICRGTFGSLAMFTAIRNASSRVGSARLTRGRAAICSGATRFHKPYPMCDECKSFAGVRISGKDYASR